LKDAIGTTLVMKDAVATAIVLKDPNATGRTLVLNRVTAAIARSVAAEPLRVVTKALSQRAEGPPERMMRNPERAADGWTGLLTKAPSPVFLVFLSSTPKATR